MRTLEEVIYAYEQCASEELEEGCGHCAYKDVPHGRCKVERNDDALQYLKILNKIVEIPDDEEVIITVKKVKS